MGERGGPGFVAGVLTGAVLGASVAMLLAPWSGEETRDLLRARAREASNRAKDAVADVSDQARSAATDAATNVSGAIAQGAQAVDNVRRTLGDAADEGRAAAAAQRAELEKRHLEQGQSD
jgi:gas vesicle protein